MSADDPVFRLATLDIPFVPFDWPWAQAEASAITTHFEAKRQSTPAMWNGRILMMRDVSITGKHLSASCYETGFADMLAWRDWNWPDHSVWNGFAQGALIGSDGAFVLGIMGGHTANAGKVFFPAGTPDHDDLIDGRLDMTASVFRELAEETGLMPADIEAVPGWTLVRDAQRLAFFRLLRLPVDAQTAADRIGAFLAREAEPELSGVKVVRSAADLVPQMPPFVQTFLSHWWSSGRQAAGG